MVQPLPNKLILLLFGFYLYLSAKVYGIYYMKEVLDNNPIKLKFADNEIKKGLLIGKTKGIIFLLDGHRVEAVPITTFLKEFELGAK